MTDAAQNTQRRILIVDDIEDNRFVLDRHLKRAGFATEMCEDGMSAMRMISESMPDLVLLDWMMPGISGLETLQAIRSSSADFIQKPYTPDSLARKVRDMLDAN